MVAFPAQYSTLDTCTDFASAIHDCMNQVGFDIDGVGVEPEGEYDLLVSCLPFPQISVTRAGLMAMVEEYMTELAYFVQSAQTQHAMTEEAAAYSK